MKVVQHRPKAERQGFTLLELLAALLLASLLMGAVFRLLKIMHAQERIIAQRTTEHESYLPRIFQLLERDLRNSRQMIVRPNEVLLSGFAGISPRQSKATHRAADVVWRTLIIHGRLCLQREERKRDVLTNQSVDRQLMAVGIAGISLWFADAPDVSWEAENASGSQWTPIPGSVIAQLDVRSEAPQRLDANAAAVNSMERRGSPNLTPHRRTLLIKSGGA